MNIFKKILDEFNLSKQCKEYNVKIWQCPQFLFLTMGMIIILAIITTNVLARRFVDPEIVALIVLMLSAALFVISHIIVNSFERIAKSSKTKSEFIGIMSHRLRSPLSATKWQMNILLGKRKTLDDEQFETGLREIERQNNKMIRIANDLLELNNIEDKSLILNMTNFSIRDVINEVIQEQKENAKTNNIDVFVSFPESLPDVFSDIIRIKNIVYCLLDNAIRYNEKAGKVTITVEELPGGYIRCLFTDEGVGISDKEAKKIFTKYFRNHDDSMHYKTEGSGISLYIAKVIIERVGGKIGFSSIEGRGSTFWFTLPISK